MSNLKTLIKTEKETIFKNVRKTFKSKSFKSQELKNLFLLKKTRSTNNRNKN